MPPSSFGILKVNNAPDLAGGFHRTIFETWLWSVYLILDGDEQTAAWGERPRHAG
jgi:hypothetical protein